MPASGPTGASESSAIVSVAIGQWAVASAPTKIRTLLGSCVGVVIYDRMARLGGLAHIVLPRSRGPVDHPGKYADTAIPAMIADFERRIQGMARANGGTGGAAVARGRLVAKLLGGACMFQSSASTNPIMNIGSLNQEAAETILGELRIPILARDLGGGSGRHLTLDTTSGIVTIKCAGKADYEV